jgi:hypothetical protein
VRSPTELFDIEPAPDGGSHRQLRADEHQPDETLAGSAPGWLSPAASERLMRLAVVALLAFVAIAYFGATPVEPITSAAQLHPVKGHSVTGHSVTGPTRPSTGPKRDTAAPDGIVAVPTYGVAQIAPEGGQHLGLVPLPTGLCAAGPPVLTMSAATPGVIAAVADDLPQFTTLAGTRTILASSGALCSMLVHSSAGDQSLDITVSGSSAGDVFETVASAQGVVQVHAVSSTGWSILVTMTTTTDAALPVDQLTVLAEDFRLTQ